LIREDDRLPLRKTLIYKFSEVQTETYNFI